MPPVDFVSIGRDVNPKGFVCTSREINRWFQGKASKQHASGVVRVTCAVEPGKPSRPYGFYALATVAEEVANLPGSYHGFRSQDHFSALQLVWLATDRGFVGEGLGSRMVGRAIRTFAQVGPEIGLPHLIVVPDPADHERLTAFYGKLGFTSYRNGEAMFLDIQSAVEAVRFAERAAAAAEVAAPVNVESTIDAPPPEVMREQEQ